MREALMDKLALCLACRREVLDEVANDGEEGFVEGLLKRKVADEDTLLAALSQVLDIPLASAEDLGSGHTDFARRVPIHFLKRHLLLPMPHAGKVALRDPMDLEAAGDLCALLHIPPLFPVLASKARILSAINHAYDEARGSVEEMAQNLEEESGESILSEIEEAADLLDDSNDAPIIKLVNHIIAQAVKANASDIHIEPYQDRFVIRYRMDGMLYELMRPAKWMQAPLVSRIKIMAKLNIAEKRLPQDGRLEVKIGGQSVDVRISTVPTAFGERVVLRLLNKANTLLGLSDFGMADDTYAALNRLIRLPNGIILVTGPTGSGKTTTLYAALAEINREDVNIVTIEDPVEYRIPGIGQIQVNPKIGLTFAKGLRSIVRQDPDVILVGEIRDQETAEIAVQSALTGHLVFSTLHTNDSASAITRLVDIGIEPFLIASAVKAVMAQRLVRILCPECKVPYLPLPEEIDTLGPDGECLRGRELFQPKGCPACLQSGYKGRMSIYEIMEMDSALKKLVLKTSDSNPIQNAAVRGGMVTLRKDGIRKIREGLTTIAEVLRVT
ncbi:type II secretion system ATPase GspE [Desulfobotulus sp.]|jgi:general secretion pathway protein E|uniref:type II secretion system ATPase GspE n=1 Tax=Desulfobotulus sp. TaxID=1940337 RepID=UPI002A36C754|nr:type II secretion system ATPase GspE [Desulfobotulus sp.]MDY0162509.1 type II secretion system ATPase GspE [Desulfobotulus sp.]